MNMSVPKGKYYYWLDTFKFMSAFFVMLTHLRFWFFQPYGLLDEGSQNFVTKVFFFLTSLGGDAVVMFFILSGFLVGGRTVEKLCNGEVVSPATFIVSRLVRIMIPLAAVLLINSLFNIVQGVPNDLWRIIGNLLCLQGVFVNPEPGIGVLWTMSYIVWFYVFILVLILLYQKRKLPVLGGLFVLILVLWVFAHMGGYLYNVLIVASGILSFYVAKQDLGRMFFVWNVIVAILTTGLCHLCGDSVSFRSLPIDNLLIKALQVVSYSVVVGGIVRIVPKAVWVKKIEKLMSRLAKCSYSLYLLHLPIIMMMVYLGVERQSNVNCWSLLLYFGGIGVCLVSSYILYVLVEKPTNMLKSRLSHS